MSTLIFSPNWLASAAAPPPLPIPTPTAAPTAEPVQTFFPSSPPPSPPPAPVATRATDAWSRQLFHGPLRCRSHSSPNGCPHGANCCAHDRAAAGPGTGCRAGRPADAGANLRQQCGAHSACGEHGCTARRRTAGMHNTCLGQCLPRLCSRVRWHSMQPSHQHRGLSRRLEIDEHMNGAGRLLLYKNVCCWLLMPGCFSCFCRGQPRRRQSTAPTPDGSRRNHRKPDQSDAELLSKDRSAPVRIFQLPDSTVKVELIILQISAYRKNVTGWLFINGSESG